MYCYLFNVLQLEILLHLYLYTCMCTATYFDFFVQPVIAMFYNWRCIYVWYVRVNSTYLLKVSKPWTKLLCCHHQCSRYSQTLERHVYRMTGYFSLLALLNSSDFLFVYNFFIAMYTFIQSLCYRCSLLLYCMFCYEPQNFLLDCLSGTSSHLFSDLAEELLTVCMNTV